MTKQSEAAVVRLGNAVRNESVEAAISASVEHLWNTMGENTICPTANDVIYAILNHQGMTREQMENQVGDFLLYLKEDCTVAVNDGDTAILIPLRGERAGMETFTYRRADTSMSVKQFTERFPQGGTVTE